jgi:hypothetical protein
MRTPFKPKFIDGVESVMSVCDLEPTEIRINQKTKEVFIVYDDKPLYSLEDIDQLSWQAIKKLVERNGGEYTNKKGGIEFLTGLVKK